MIWTTTVHLAVAPVSGVCAAILPLAEAAPAHFPATELPCTPSASSGSEIRLEIDENKQKATKREVN